MGIYGKYINYEENDIRALSEAYIGKTPTLLEIEKQIGVVRSILKKYTDINRHPEVLKLNRLIEKQFGMDVFALHIEQENTINAYTCVVGVNFDIAFKEMLSKKITGDKKNGYRFKEGNGLCIICNIYLGLIGNPIFTDGEILAVLLHEIGHNFSEAFSKDIEIANKNLAKEIYNSIIICSILTLGLGAISFSNFSNKNKVKKESKNRKTRQNILTGLFKGIGSSINDFTDLVGKIQDRLETGLMIKFGLAKIKSPSSEQINKMKKSSGRQDEVIADKFAGVYGYGPEQASALYKMSMYSLNNNKAEKIVNNIPIIGKLANSAYYDFLKDFDFSNFDVHPNLIQRINEEIKTLEDELNKADIDPKVVKVVKKQVKQLNKLKNEITTISSSMTQKEKDFAKNLANMMENNPDAVSKELERKILDSFDEILEEGEN